MPFANHVFAFFRIRLVARVLTIGAVSSGIGGGGARGASGPPFLFFLTDPIAKVLTPVAAASLRTSTTFVPITVWNFVDPSA
jgi:hypothetical protein